MFIDDDKIMLVVQTYNAECYYRELQTFYSTSFDNGNTWSEPISFPNGINGISIRQGIKLSNNSYLFPIYYGEVINNFDWQNVKKWHDNFRFCCGVIISNDKLKSYERYGYIKSEKCLWEPNCIEIENGHIIMYMRNNNDPYLGISHSYDYGKTWSTFKKTDIPNPNTKVTLIKANDLILLISNFNNIMGFKNRTHLQIWISKDGENFYKQIRIAIDQIRDNKKIKLEDDDKLFFYPHAFFDENSQLLYVAYENSKQFWLKKIPFKEINEA